MELEGRLSGGLGWLDLNHGQTEKSSSETA